MGNRNFSRRDFLRTSFVGAAGLALTACIATVPQSGAGGNANTSSADAEAVMVRYVFVADPGELEIRQKGMDEFQERTPSIKVDGELIPEDGMAQKIVTMVAGGAAPDTIYVHPSFIPLFATQQVLTVLNDYAQRDSDYNAADFFETIAGHFVRDGYAYAYPYYSGPIVSYFNKTIFDEAGEPYPTEYTAGFADGSDEWTWQKALEVGTRLTKGEGADKVFGNWPLSMSLHWYDHLVWSFGGDVWDEAMTKCLLGEPAAMEALQYQIDTILTHNIAPVPQQSEGMPGGFTSGRVAMITNGIKADVPGFVEAKMELGMAPVPQGPSARATRDGPNGIGILNSSKVKDAAWEWLKYMTGPVGGDPGGIRFEFELNRALPTRRSLYDASVFVDNLLPWEDLEVYRNASQHVRVLPLPDRYAECNSVWQENWGTIVAGSMTPEDAVQAACTEIDHLLNEAA